MMPQNIHTVLFSLLTITGGVFALPAENSAPLDKRYDLTCDGNSVPVGEAQRCVEYLNWLGDAPCVIDGDNAQFCSVGNPPVKLTGSNMNQSGRPSSRCRDVAAGAQQLLDRCTQNGVVSGSTAAVGNGDIIVSFTH